MSSRVVKKIFAMLYTCPCCLCTEWEHNKYLYLFRLVHMEQTIIFTVKVHITNSNPINSKSYADKLGFLSVHG